MTIKGQKVAPSVTFKDEEVAPSSKREVEGRGCTTMLQGRGVSLCCKGEGEEADVDKVKCETGLMVISHGVTQRLGAVPITLDLQTVIPPDLLRFSQRSREGHLARDLFVF